MLYETQWEGLRHKWIEISFVVSRFPDPVDQTTQETESTTTNYWESFQNRILNLSYVDTNVHLWKPDSIQHVSGTEQIKEDIQGSFPHNNRVMLSSGVDVILDLTDTSSNYRETHQRQVENLWHVSSDVTFPDYKSFQHIDEVDTKVYLHGSYLDSTIKAPQSDADQYLTHIESGTVITDFTELQKYQIEKQTSEISEQFDILSQRENNWDERGSLKPTNLTLAHARGIMDAYINSVTSAGYQCNAPTISSDGDGEVTAVWYKGERQLHFQIGEQEVEYFRVWGTNIDTEMDVDFLKPEDYLSHWKWLIDEF